MSKIKIHKNEHPIFNFLRKKNDMFLFDTETTGLGTRDEPAEMVELYGIKFSLKKDIKINVISKNEKHTVIEVLFNNYNKKFNIKNVETDDLLQLMKDRGVETTDGNTISIKEDIPFVLDYKNDKENLMFNSVGDLVFVEEIDKLYKSKKPIEIPAMVVHKIIDRDKIKKTEYLTLMDAYLEKYKDKESNIKLLNELIDDFHILNKGKKILNEFEEKLRDSKREDLKLKYTEKINHIKSLLDSSGTLDAKKEKIFERFLNEFGFRENTNQPYFVDNKTEIEYVSRLVNENLIRGHNVYNFDIKKILEKNGLDTIKNPLVLDTMHFDIQLGAKNVTNMDKLIKNYLKKELKKLSTDYKHLVNKLPDTEELQKVNKIFDKWFDNDLDKERVVDSIENLNENDINIVKDFFKSNNLDNFESFNYINKILTKKMERKTIHTAKLDIELNSFVIESQLKDYVEKFGLEDVLTEEKVVKNLLEVEEIKNIDEIELKGYLGLKSDFSKTSSASSSRIAEKMTDLGFKKFALSDEIFHNAYDNYKDFSKKGLENINVIEVKVKELDESVSIILPNPKSLDVLPIINEMSIYKEDLEIAIKELGLFVAVPKSLDGEFNSENVFVKVEPYSLEEYTNLKNKRVLWINNKYVENSNIEKGLNYMKKTRFNNIKTSPIEDNNRINLDKNYQDGHIPTKEELLNIFPYEEYKDIYENSNFILDNSKGFKPYRQNVKPLPSTTRLVDGLKENPETPEEYKKLMYRELRKAWETREMMNVVKKTAIKRYVDNKKNYYSYLTQKQINNLTKEEILEANRFVNEIDLGKLSSNKEKFYEFIENEIKNNREFNDFVKEVKEEYTARIVYEVETLGNFGNYETVFNYYFQMRKILQTLEKNGIGHGPGRGSAAGSMLAYMLGITEVDPIPFNLLFERFMNPERVSEPDVDTDIPYGENITKEYVIDILNKEFSLNNKELKKLLVEENGFNEKIVDTMIKRNYSNYATKIATKIKSTNKTILSNYLRTRGLPQMALRNFLKEYNTDLSMEDNINIVNELNTPFLDSVKGDLEQLDDLLLSTGAHAGGVMIPNLPENALSLVVNGTSVFDKNIAEHETKWDLLGLKSMVLYFKLRMKKEKSLKTNQVEELNFNFNVLDDTNVFEVIQKGLNANIFQIESDGMKRMLKSLAPLDFETLIAALALYRPGPIEAGAVDAFITNKYIDLQKKYKRYVDKANVEKVELVQGKLQNSLTDKRYDLIKDKKFKQLVSPRLFNDIMNATSYFDSKTFKDNIRNGLAAIAQRVKDGEVFDNDELEELKVLERDFVKFYNQENDIELAIKNTIEVASNLEKNIISSDLYMDITKETYGTIVYQEQIMSIATRISGFTKGGSDLLRKAVAKQKYEDLMKIKPELVKGMYDKLDRIDNKDVKIERNKEFETVVNYKGKDINFFNSKFNVENNRVVFELTPDTKKLYEIYKSFGQEDKDIKQLEDDLKTVNFEIKNNKDNNLTFELNSKKFKLQEQLFNKMNSVSDIVKPFIEKQFENIEIKDSEVKREKTFNKKVAEYLFDKIVGFGSYAFNKSHSASYRLLTYDFAFHKYYYPEKFYALSLEDSSLESAQRIFREITNTDINVKLMNVNKMNKDFDYDLKEKTITFSPMKIKSVKKQSIIAIYEELKRNGEFKSLMDLKNRIPKSLLDKKSILQLGNSGVLDELISPLTPKLFSEQFENINSILDSILEKNQKEFKNEIKNKEADRYLKLINKIKKNEILEIQIAEYKNQADSLQKMFEVDSIDKSETFTSEEDEQLVIGVKEDEEKIDDEELNKKIKENKETLLELEKKLEHIPEEDLIFFNNFEKIYSKEIKTTLKKDISSEDLIKDLLVKIENDEDAKTAKEFKEKIKNQETYTEEELNKVYMEVFAEYNFRKTVVNLDDKKVDREDMLNFIDTYYETVLKNIEGKFPNELDGIKKPEFYVGKTPKILFLSEVLPMDYQNIDKVSINGITLTKEARSFNDANGKTVNYLRFLDDEEKEYKILKTQVEVDGESVEKRVVQKKNGKTWETIDDEKNVVEIVCQNKILSYIDEMIKSSGNDNLTVDDFAIFSFYPTEKKKDVKAKILKEPIYQLTLKKLLKEKNFEIPMMIVTGTEPIKKIKDIPSIKYNTDYYFPYTFNWLNTTEQKEKNLENSSKRITTVSFTEGAWNYSWSKDKVMVDKVNNINKGFLNIINNISGKEPENQKSLKVTTSKEIGMN